MNCISVARIASVLVAMTLISLQSNEAFANGDGCKAFNDTGATWAIRACNVSGDKELDLKLARSWKRLMSDAKQFDIANRGEDHFGVTMVRQLETEQKEWFRYRETVCGYYWKGNYFGEAGSEFNGPACVDEIVKQRIKYLDDADGALNSAR